MGFIDYAGTKEDRYSDVLQYAKDQFEEEQKRLALRNANQWMMENGCCEFTDLQIGDLLKYIILWYRKLKIVNEKIQPLTIQVPELSHEQMWCDFSVWIVWHHLKIFHITSESRQNNLRVFSEKVFQIDVDTAGQSRWQQLLSNQAYRSYYASCYDLHKGAH